MYKKAMEFHQETWLFGGFFVFRCPFIQCPMPGVSGFAKPIYDVFEIPWSIFGLTVKSRTRTL